MSQLTLPHLAGLTPSDWEIKIVDENVTAINFQEPADLVAITAITPAAPQAYEIAKKFHNKNNKVKIVMGGIHPSCLPFEAAEYADAVVIGEAEGVWAQLLEDFKNRRLQKFYQTEEKHNLKDLPRPRRELINAKLYINIPKAETSRGCPRDCEFCSANIISGRKIRYRPVEEVVAELKDLKVHFVFFTDNNIVGNPKYAKELFKALKPLNISWLSQGDLKLADDPKLLQLAAESGCVGMLIGFESLNPEAIVKIGKKRVNRVQEYASQVRKIHQAGIGIIGCFVLGFDEDIEETFENTLNFIKKTNIEVPQFTLLTPYPATPLRTRLEKEERILHNNWTKYDTTHVTIYPKQMSPRDLRKNYDKICRKAYSRIATYWRLLEAKKYLKTWYKVLVFWQINSVYRKLWQVAREDPNTLPNFIKPGNQENLQQK